MTVRTAFDVAFDLLFPEPNPYVNDPVRWVRDRLEAHLWSVGLNHGRPQDSSAGGGAVGARNGEELECGTSGGVVARYSSSARGLRGDVGPHRLAGQGHPLARNRVGPPQGGLPGRVTQDAQWKINDELVAFGRKLADITVSGEDEMSGVLRRQVAYLGTHCF